MVERATWTAPDDEAYPPCHCGREVRKLNAASDTPKCVGCGLPDPACACQDQTT